MRTLAQQYYNVYIDDEPKQGGGNRTGRRANKERLAKMYDALLFKDYFSDDPIFDDTNFRRCNSNPERSFFFCPIPRRASVETYMKLLQHCPSSSGMKFFPFRVAPPAMT